MRWELNIYNLYARWIWCREHDPFQNYYDCHKICTHQLYRKNRWFPDLPLYDYKECFRLVLPTNVSIKRNAYPSNTSKCKKCSSTVQFTLKECTTMLTKLAPARTESNILQQFQWPEPYLYILPFSNKTSPLEEK